MDSMLEEETFRVDNNENVIFFSILFDSYFFLVTGYSDSVVVQKLESWNLLLH